MLKIEVRGEERWDEDKEIFVPPLAPVTLVLEHSLISLSKWESKWHKPYLSSELNTEEALDYIRCMTINSVDDKVSSYITGNQLNEVADYIRNPMTATWFTDEKMGAPHKSGRMRGEIITAEVIYYWMISGNIPVEFEKWHLNRLLTLIRVIGEKNKPPKKMSMAEITKRNAALNAARRAKSGSKG